jgi:hypothetical protein
LKVGTQEKGSKRSKAAAEEVKEAFPGSQAGACQQDLEQSGTIILVYVPTTPVPARSPQHGKRTSTREYVIAYY